MRELEFVMAPIRRILQGAMLATLLFLAGAPVAWSGVVLPAGAELRLGGGTLSLGGGSLTLGGTLEVHSGQLSGITDLTTLAGGLLNGGSGLIELSRDWLIQGSFVAASSEVRLVDGPSPSSQLRGSNGFHGLTLTSSMGKRIVLEPESEQTIRESLTITGTASNPIQIERLPSGPVARVNLLAGGSQSIAHVGVSNVHATGQPLAPTLTNEGGSGNAFGWFGIGFPSTTPVPASSPFSQALLMMLILLAAHLGLSKFVSGKN